MKTLRECKLHGTIDHYEVVSNDRKRFKCTTCAKEAVARSRRKQKKILVEEAGGCCQKCGYKGSMNALAFHHLDPGTKVSLVMGPGGTRSLARARAEAAKCVLLCMNCHAEEHDDEYPR